MTSLEMTAEPPHASLPNLSDKLRLAASKGQIDKVQELVQSGASFQPDKDGRSALHYAALNGYSEVCKYLISQQCPLDIQDASGFTALHRAASQGHMEVIRCLLEEGCAIDRQDEHGNAALHEASWNGFSSALELLIKHSCNVVVTNKAGFTALHLSAQNGHNQSTRVLLYGGCNPDLKNNYGDTALHTAARYGHAGVTRILISARCCLNEQNKNGDTALHIASALKRRKIAKLLVEAKIDVYITNKQNETAIDVARRKEHPEIIVIITTMSRSKTPKASQQSRLHPQPQKEVNFKEVPVDIVDGPMVVPDVLVKSDKPNKEKSMFSFFKKKKPKQEKEKGIELVTMASSAGQKDGEKSVKGFFSQYVPRPGNQYYRDLAGNIKQGPIGYTPICHCGPALHRLEQQLHTDHDNIYQHMDASNKVLHNRIDQLDKRTAQQVFAIDKLTKERLMQEEQGCHNRINRRFEEERVYNNNNFQGQMEQFLEAKLAAYGHCLDHHHDDSALPNNNIFTDIHETANGRLFKSRSDETLSQSDYSGKFRKKQFYESRQAAMQQMRAWQVPNVNKVRENRKPEKFPQAKTMSQGQIYSKQGQIAIGQIQVHSAPMREREEARVAVNGSQYDMLSPSTASTSGRTPNVLSPMDSVNTRQDFSGQGAIPKRLIPHSQTWHNSQQFRDNSIHRDPSPLNHSTPKSRDSSPYEVMHAVTRPGSGGMVRSHTDNEGLHRATRQRQSFPERGSSNTSTGTNLTSNSSGAGQGPQANQEQSSTKTGEGGGKYYENKPTFTTFGYPDNMEPRSPSQERTHDNGEGVVVDNNDSKPVQPRPGSSLREESPYGPFPVKPEVPRKPEVSRKPGFQEQNVSRTNNNVKENGSQYGYFVNNKDDMYLSMQQQRPVSVRQRTRSSDELLLDELELTSAHDMAKGHRSRLQQNYTEGRNNDYVRPQVNQGHNGQGQRYASQGQWPNHGQNDLAYQRPTSTRQSDQGQGRYFSVNGRSQAQPENRFSTVKGDPRYGSRDGSRTPVENQYVSSRDVSQYHIDSAHYNSPVKQGAPYHSTYYLNRAEQSGDQHISMDGSDKNISLSKSESNLMERTSDNSASHNFPCNTPVTGVEDSPRGKDIRSVANYPNAYAKEDSSSNPDSGYSSKIFGNRLHPGAPRSNSGTPSFNSTSPSFNSGTPSSSFSADHSMSTPGQSHTNSPSVLVTNPDYEQIPASRDQYNQSLKSHVNNWYQRQLQESAHRLHDGIYVGSPQKQYHAQSSSQTSGKPLQGSSKSHHLPHYEQTPPPQQYGNQSYSSSQGYHGNQSYANYQHVSSFVRGSDV